MFDKDTIIAEITPPGTGAVSVIRLSGTNAITTADFFFNGKHKLIDSKSHTLHYGNFKYDGETIDDVIVSIFKSPNSYTGENVDEISFHS